MTFARLAGPAVARLAMGWQVPGPTVVSHAVLAVWITFLAVTKPPRRRSTREKSGSVVAAVSTVASGYLPQVPAAAAVTPDHPQCFAILISSTEFRATIGVAASTIRVPRRIKVHVLAIVPIALACSIAPMGWTREP